MTLDQAIEELRTQGNPTIAERSRRFFKTAPGEYGEGDRFLGLRVPRIRAVVKRCSPTSVDGMTRALRSPFHEQRLFALLLMLREYQRGDGEGRRSIYQAYLDHTEWINNWDLVDSSAPGIIGAYLQDRDRSPLFELACSGSLWERRIAMMATLHFIRGEQFDAALAIAELLLDDEQDLIHKCVGWMLREVGHRQPELLRSFLKDHYPRLPRTTLRYAIEKFSEAERQAYLKGRF